MQQLNVYEEHSVRCRVKSGQTFVKTCAKKYEKEKYLTKDKLRKGINYSTDLY